MGLTSKLSGMRVRLRLTLLYGALFLVSGAVLLAITYFLVAQGGTNVVMTTNDKLPDGGETVSTYVLGSLPDADQLPETERRISQALQLQAAQQQDDLLNKLLTRSGLALAIMSVLSVLLGWLVAGRVLRPLQTMTSTIQLISARNVHERLAVTGPRDELRDLADTIDGLLGRLEAALDSHKRFVANAAHELRTPLTLEHALLEEAVIDPGATVESYRAQFELLMGVSEQQARLLESLLVLATSERGLDRSDDVDLADLTGAVVRAAEPKARKKDVTVVAEIQPARVTGDAALVERLAANLVDNALSYNVPGGRVEVAAGTADGRTFLTVGNTGPQVPPAMVDQLLHPFQRLSRTADDGHHGLGLSIVQSIATAHAAELTVLARPAGGLEIRVLFPPG